MRSRRPSSQDEAEDQVQDPEEEKLNALTIEDQNQGQDQTEPRGSGDSLRRTRPENQDNDYDPPQDEQDRLSEGTIYHGSDYDDEPPAPGGRPAPNVSRFVPIFPPSVKSTATDANCTSVINKIYVDSPLQYDVEDVDSVFRLKLDIKQSISTVCIVNGGRGSAASSDTAMWDLIKTNVTSAKGGELKANEALHFYGMYLYEFLQIDDVFRH